MIKKILYIAILAILSSQLKAQVASDYDKLKFGKIEPSDFDAKPFGKDSAATAVILFDVASLDFGINDRGRWAYTLERHKRIKILKKEGSQYGNFEIVIFQNSNYKEILGSIKTASYNLVDGKVKQSKSSKDEKFKDQFNEDYTNYKYTVSDVQEGTIIEIQYKIQSDVIFTLRDWYFQSEIPTIWSEFTFALPEYFDYKLNFQVMHPVELESDETKPILITGLVGSSSTHQSDAVRLNCMSRVRKWTSKNIPAFKNEAYITTEDDYLTKLGFEIQSTRFPGDTHHNYSTTWEKVIEGYKEAGRFGDFIKPNNYSKKLVATIISEGDKSFDKADKIFKYVKNNVKWNEKNGDYSVASSPKAVIEDKVGNIGDINLTLLSLLKSADLNAQPVILSTRSNGKHPGYPMASKFNYVVVKLTVDTTSYLLDASNINNAPDLINPNALNHHGFVVDLDQKTGKWMSTDPKDFSSTLSTFSITFDKDLKLKVGSFSKKTNYDGLNFRHKYQSFSTEAEYLKDYASNKNGLKIINYNASEVKNPELPIVEKIDYEVTDYIEEAGNLVYFNPLMYERYKENPFKEEVRNFPVDFSYPRLESFRIVITIPEGYTLDKLPESINYMLQDNSASFLYTCIQSDKQVLISCRISFNKNVFSPESYPDLKELFKHIVAKQNQPLVLKKI